MENVAVIADVHGVLPVLEAVMAEPDLRAADRIVVCGDHAAGPQPVEVLDLLAGMDNVVPVRGNADRELVALGRGEPSTVGDPYEIDAWAAAQLSPEHIQLLAVYRPLPLVARATCLDPAHGAVAPVRIAVRPGAVATG